MLLFTNRAGKSRFCVSFGQQLSAGEEVGDQSLGRVRRDGLLVKPVPPADPFAGRFQLNGARPGIVRLNTVWKRLDAHVTLDAAMFPALFRLGSVAPELMWFDPTFYEAL